MSRRLSSKLIHGLPITSVFNKKYTMLKAVTGEDELWDKCMELHTTRNTFLSHIRIVHSRDILTKSWCIWVSVESLCIC